MNDRDPWHSFEVYGIELEYMIAGATDLSVRPIADELLVQAGGSYDKDVERGAIAWSNELMLHLIELKTNGPAATLAGLAATFQAELRHVNSLLASADAKLLPTGMHPWMDPHRESRLWPHENNVIYRTFDRIFDCRGHGWANLQSAHLNLPFADDREFGALHAAIRLVLPVIPGLAASSPFADGAASGFLDTRLAIYRNNASRVPSVAGHVIPERVFTRRAYEELLGSIYSDLLPLDPEGVLRHEWVNARGCIARFERMAIEIRVIDMQECPAADLAIAAAIVSAIRCLVEEHWSSGNEQGDWDERELAALMGDVIRDADHAVIDNRRLLASFGYPERGRARVRDLWQHLIETELARDPNFPEWSAALRTYLERGCLARRIVEAAGPRPDREALGEVYGRLADCAASGALFEPT